MQSLRVPFRVLLVLGLAGAGLAALGWMRVEAAGPRPPRDLPLPVPDRAAASPALTVRIPSPEGTGLPTGTLVVRVFGPPPGGARYADGAPVLVWAPGGTTAGSLSEPLPILSDTVRLAFLMPGGCQGPALCSDGTYDERGRRSIAALRDVLRYAAGLLDDVMGHPIDDAVDVPVLHDNVGLYGASNGGNVVQAVAALHGQVLSGHLRYIVQWESPVSSQIATVDLGAPSQDCVTGSQRILSANPRYLAYGPLSVTMDYTQLTYTTTNPLHPVFWDGNGDGRYTTVLDPSTGCQTPDLDGDGVMDADEDFPLRTYPAEGGRQVYSRPVARALAEGGIIAGPWLPDVLTPAQTNAYWDLREAVRLYVSATLAIPDLRAMVLSSVTDHVQAPADRPHIRQALEGWQRAGAWVRLNPDPSYVLEINPALAGRPDLPNNPPNSTPADWSGSAYAYPDDLETIYPVAAVHEMADRVHGGRWYALYLPVVLR